MSKNLSPAEVDEYQSRPIPMSGRLGFKQPAWVWSGFGIAFICAVIGGVIQQGLGTWPAIAAILLGNVILFFYASALGYASGKWGMNFPLTVRATFGRVGAVLPILVLAALVTGWYSFHTWLTADIIRVAFDVETPWIIAAAAVAIGAVYAAPVIFGIKSMALVRQIAIPAMVLFVVYYLIVKVIPVGSDLFAREGDGSVSFWGGVGLAWATFAVSGTMTGDIVRYVRSGKQAVGVTGVAFLLSNGPFMILGALFAAAINNPDVPYFLDTDSSLILLALAAIAVLSTWSTADACLYNASMGISNSFKGITWQKAGITAAVLGILLAASGVIGNVTNILITIGLVVPPVGAVIITDYFVLRRGHGFGADRVSPINWAAIAATLAGIGTGIAAHILWPQVLFGLPGMIVTAVTYLVLARVGGAALGAEEPTLPTDAEFQAPGVLAHADERP